MPTEGQEREPLSLKEMLEEKRRAKERTQMEAEAQEKAESEQTIRSQIADLEGKKSQLTSLFQRLTDVYGREAPAVDEAKAQNDQIKKLVLDFQDVLEGISKKQILSADDFKKTPEIQKFTSTRDSLSSIACEIKELIDQLKEEVPDFKIARGDKATPENKKTRLTTREARFQTIQKALDDLDGQIKSLRAQTEEGKIEKRQALIDSVIERHRGDPLPSTFLEYNYDRRLTIKDTYDTPLLDKYTAVSEEDIVVAKSVDDEDAIREALKNDIAARMTQEYEEVKRQNRGRNMGGDAIRLKASKLEAVKKFMPAILAKIDLDWEKQKLAHFKSQHQDAQESFRLAVSKDHYLKYCTRTLNEIDRELTSHFNERVGLREKPVAGFECYFPDLEGKILAAKKTIKDYEQKLEEEIKKRPPIQKIIEEITRQIRERQTHLGEVEHLQRKYRILLEEGLIRFEKEMLEQKKNRATTFTTIRAIRDIIDGVRKKTEDSLEETFLQEPLCKLFLDMIKNVDTAEEIYEKNQIS